ncbi:protrudin isoform X2 [Callorhinchus milii]|uniref:protrudin isoform X2 n=1 Tax=Callorhinchus milii TaxID=7868 RepID=UPI0004573B6C|nr:protrudin isoform X2 [Callorhinchus milii]|eukprot:gi/632984610/ref/XP_007909225.1/ PREDICTED: protrudin isoform X2 [Callorhinchus milii]
MQPLPSPAVPCESPAVAESVDKREPGAITAATATVTASPGPPGNGSPELEVHPAAETACEPRPQTFDMLSLVVASKRLEFFAEPLTDLWEMVKYLIRWKSPVFSLSCCVTLNVLFLALSEAGWFTLLALVISVPAALGYLQDCCREQLTEQAVMRRRNHTVRREDLQKVKITRQEALVEIKSFLIQLGEMLNRTCNRCEAAYRVLYWEDHSISFLFYGSLLGALSVFYLLPLCWVLALLNSALFLGNRDFHRVITDYKGALFQNIKCNAQGVVALTEPDGTLNLDPTLTSGTPEEISAGNLEESEEQEPEDEFKDAIEEDDDGPQCSVDYELIAQDNGFFNKNEPIRSKVSKLTEKLRKRYPVNNSGNCNSCTTTFSVLKKRRNCSNCGNSYCSRCCSSKVPKSSMGATAPDAQREMVFVCAQCHQILSK